jgi:hypothetical protein
VTKAIAASRNGNSAAPVAPSCLGAIQQHTRGARANDKPIPLGTVREMTAVRRLQTRSLMLATNVGWSPWNLSNASIAVVFDKTASASHLTLPPGPVPGNFLELQLVSS